MVSRATSGTRAYLACVRACLLTYLLTYLPTAPRTRTCWSAARTTASSPTGTHARGATPRTRVSSRSPTATLCTPSPGYRVRQLSSAPPPPQTGRCAPHGAPLMVRPSWCPHTHDDGGSPTCLRHLATASHLSPCAPVALCTCRLMYCRRESLCPRVSPPSLQTKPCDMTATHMRTPGALVGRPQARLWLYLLGYTCHGPRCSGGTSASLASLRRSCY